MALGLRYLGAAEERCFQEGNTVGVPSAGNAISALPHNRVQFCLVRPGDLFECRISRDP
jgi:hypothetical protein